jgi:hypothetical protein
MTPHDVAADDSRLLRFQNEVAYLDRMQPSEDEVRDDTELLDSKDGVLVIAWLWPSPTYEPRFDPFDAASRENQVLWENAARDSRRVGAEKALKTASRAFDRQRQSRRQVAASRFVRIIESTAQAVGCSVEDLKTHLQWSAPLTQLELDRLLRGYTPFPFPVIARLCSALQLEFTHAWVLIDPQRLERRIAQSVLASGISSHLSSLTLDNLESVVRKLPRGSVDGGQAQEFDIYRAPQPGGRYWSMYKALAADERASPDYTFAEIDRLLVDSGEVPLPESARADRSWWAGNGAKTEGRPQVSAWWAAGYRIRHVAIDPSSGRVASIGFEALPGRAEWLANPERAVGREYRVPGPVEVEIEAQTRGLDLEGAKAGLTEMAAAIERLKDLHRSIADARAKLEENVPDDPDIRRLTELLERRGEADRSQIERHFNQVRDEPVDAAWMTNLLTRARRQGWTVNNGTRSQPRWAATRQAAELIEDIADTLNLETPAIDPGDAVPVEFLRLVARSVGVHSASSSAPQIARRIIESSGGTWQPAFESADKSLTGLGLKAVRDALELHTTEPDQTG